MRAGRAGLSIGAKLALRYALATAATITVLGAFVYGQIERRINRQATLVLDVQTQDLADALDSQLQEHDSAHVVTWFEQQARQRIDESPDDLGLGIQLLDASGRGLVAGGSLAEGAPPFVSPPSRDAWLRAVDMGGEHAHHAAADLARRRRLRTAERWRGRCRTIYCVVHIVLAAGH